MCSRSMVKCVGCRGGARATRCRVAARFGRCARAEGSAVRRGRDLRCLPSCGVQPRPSALMAQVPTTTATTPPPPPIRIRPPRAPQGVNYAIQNGAHLSRAKVLFFRHNDLADLERLLEAQDAADRRSRRVHRGRPHAHTHLHRRCGPPLCLACSCCSSGTGSRPAGPVCGRLDAAPRLDSRERPRSRWLRCQRAAPLCYGCRKPLNRRFIVVEGIYANTGDLAPLRELKALKEVGTGGWSAGWRSLSRGQPRLGVAGG